MKKMKKFLSMLLAMAMVLGMSMTTFAVDDTDTEQTNAPSVTTKPIEGDIPSADDKMPINIVNLNGDEVSCRAFRLIEATYDTKKGFTGYVWSEGTDYAGDKVTLDNKEQVVNLTSHNVNDWAKRIDELIDDGLYEEKNYSLNTELEVGTWLLIITSTKNPGTVYNPMIASIYYTDEGNKTSSDPLDTKSSWSTAVTDAYVKSTEIGKGDNEKKTAVGVTSGTAEVGDVIEFKLEGVIPAYSKEYYTDPVYTLTDTITKGLKYVREDETDGVGVTVTIGGSQAKESDYELITDPDGKSFSVAITSAKILQVSTLSSEGRKVEVTYKAKVTEEAKTEVAENKFEINYTRGQGDDTGKVEKVEYVSTLALKGVFQKVNEDGKVPTGAEFTLYEKNVDEDNAKTYTVEEDGAIQFSGLKDTTYKLVETAAPAGYSINNTVYTIEFEDITFETIDGKETNKIAGYTVVVTGGDLDSNGVKFVFTGYGDSATTNNMDEIKIVNTALISLPSTGGIGTTIFTIGGCTIMIIAAGLYFSLRRRTER